MSQQRQTATLKDLESARLEQIKKAKEARTVRRNVVGKKIGFTILVASFTILNLIYTAYFYYLVNKYKTNDIEIINLCRWVMSINIAVFTTIYMYNWYTQVCFSTLDVIPFGFKVLLVAILTVQWTMTITLYTKLKELSDFILESSDVNLILYHTEVIQGVEVLSGIFKPDTYKLSLQNNITIETSKEAFDRVATQGLVKLKRDSSNRVHAPYPMVTDVMGEVDAYIVNLSKLVNNEYTVSFKYKVDKDIIQTDFKYKPSATGSTINDSSIVYYTNDNYYTDYQSLFDKAQIKAKKTNDYGVYYLEDSVPGDIKIFNTFIKQGGGKYVSLSSAEIIYIVSFVLSLVTCIGLSIFIWKDMDEIDEAALGKSQIQELELQMKEMKAIEQLEKTAQSIDKKTKQKDYYTREQQEKVLAKWYTASQTIKKDIERSKEWKSIIDLDADSAILAFENELAKLDSNKVPSQLKDAYNMFLQKQQETAAKEAAEVKQQTYVKNLEQRIGSLITEKKDAEARGILESNQSMLDSITDPTLKNRINDLRRKVPPQLPPRPVAQAAVQGTREEVAPQLPPRPVAQVAVQGTREEVAQVVAPQAAAEEVKAAKELKTYILDHEEPELEKIFIKLVDSRQTQVPYNDLDDLVKTTIPSIKTEKTTLEELEKLQGSIDKVKKDVISTQKTRTEELITSLNSIQEQYVLPQDIPNSNTMIVQPLFTDITELRDQKEVTNIPEFIEKINNVDKRTTNIISILDTDTIMSLRRPKKPDINTKERYVKDAKKILTRLGGMGEYEEVTKATKVIKDLLEKIQILTPTSPPRNLASLSSTPMTPPRAGTGDTEAEAKAGGSPGVERQQLISSFVSPQPSNYPKQLQLQQNLASSSRNPTLDQLDLDEIDKLDE